MCRNKKDSNIVGTIHELSVANKLYGGKLRAICRIPYREKKNIKFVGTIHELSVEKNYMAVNCGRFVGIPYREKRNIKFVGTIHELSVVKIHITVNYGRFVNRPYEIHLCRNRRQDQKWSINTIYHYWSIVNSFFKKIF